MARAAYVYMLACADGTLYTGWAYDVRRRLRAHQAGRGCRYTRSRRPLRLVYLERCSGRSQAQQRERELKRLQRTAKLNLIDDKRRRKCRALR